MSNRYKGGVISATPPTTTGGEEGAASGAWTLEQQAQLQAAGLWPSQPPPLYIENVFSTYLYTGTGAAQTITNGINLSGKGGLVWGKARGGVEGGYSNFLQDTVRGTGQTLFSNNTDGNTAVSNIYINSFNSNGFTLGTNGTVNNPGSTFVSWTFREQPKFFDVVTYSGTGVDMAVNHNLQAQPGCVIIKRLNASSDWNVMFPGLISDGYGGTGRMSLNLTDAYSATGWTSVANSTQITIPTNTPAINEVGGTYIAYLFASNAGGFGLTESENAITCGTYTGNGSTTGPIITLGYEPQWLMIKRTNSTGSWYIFDSMRGLRNSGGVWLVANTPAAEDTSVNIISSLATGFQPVQTGTATNGGGDTYVYIAIRRGPMAVPTDSTGLYSANRYQYPTGYGGGLTITPVSGAAGGYGGFPTDLFINTIRNQSGDGNRQLFADRLRGIPALWSTQTFAEASPAPPGSDVKWDNMVGVTTASAPYYVYTPYVFTNYFLRRAPSFFDVVCYTGNGTAGQTYSHNLTVAPELMIIKSRSASGNWPVYSTATGNTNVIYLNYDTYASASNEWNNTTPTASVFTLGINSSVNNSGTTYVAYLFATCAGVSKVGSYTGTGATQTINCGFSGGARFVMIKRYDSGTTGNWWVWDTVSGMVAGTDNRIPMNTTDAEANNNWVYTASTGFEIVTTDASVNASGGTYIFLAIA